MNQYPNIFISYSTKDVQIVEPIVEKLKPIANIFFDVEKNQDKEAIIGKAAAFICFLSTNYFDKIDYASEFIYAQQTKRRMICVNIEDGMHNKCVFNTDELVINALNDNQMRMCADKIISEVEHKSMNNKIGLRVFISYCHKNKEIVQSVANNLKEWADVWLDEERTNIFHKLYSELQIEIQKCDVLICFTSKDYLESDICINECTFANQEKKKILHVELDNIELTDGLKFLLHTKSCSRPNSYRNQAEIITRELKEALDSLKAAQNVSNSQRDENNNKRTMVTEKLRKDNKTTFPMNGKLLDFCFAEKTWFCVIQHDQRFQLWSYYCDFNRTERLLHEKRTKMLIASCLDRIIMLETDIGKLSILKSNRFNRRPFEMTHEHLKKGYSMTCSNQIIYIPCSGMILRLMYNEIFKEQTSLKIDYRALEIKINEPEKVACIVGARLEDTENQRWFIHFCKFSSKPDDDGKLDLIIAVNRGQCTIGRFSKIDNYFYEYVHTERKYRCYDTNGQVVKEFEPTCSTIMNEATDGVIKAWPQTYKFMIGYSKGAIIYS